MHHGHHTISLHPVEYTTERVRAYLRFVELHGDTTRLRREADLERINDGAALVVELECTEPARGDAFADGELTRSFNDRV